MKKSRHYRTGLFVLAGLLILVIFVFFLGARNLFQKKFILETYFDESVHGLDVGSTVKYRGVAIGNVKDISFVQDAYDLPNEAENPQGRYVLVKMSLRDVFDYTNNSMKPLIAKMIADGLRVKITSQGLTGTAYLEIDYVNPEHNPPMNISWTPKSFYIPSTRSTFTKIGASIDELIKKIDKADIDKLVRNLDTLVITMDKGINEAKIAELSSSSINMINEFQHTSKKFREFISSPSVQSFPSKMETAVNSMNSSMNRLNTILSNNQGDISRTVENLRAVSEDLREFSGNAKRNPSSLIFSDSPTQSSSIKR